MVFSFTRILEDPTSENFGYLSSLASVEKVDELTFVASTMKAPFSAFPRNTSLISIVPDQAYAAMGPEAFAAAPVGSGPFKFEKIQRWRGSYDLVRNDSYWGEPGQAGRGQPGAGGLGRVPGQRRPLRLPGRGPDQPRPGGRSKGSGGGTVQSELSNGVVFLGVNSTAGVLADEKTAQGRWHGHRQEGHRGHRALRPGEPATQMLAPGC